MCYSAMVEQNSKKLGLRFKARIQTQDYHDLYQRRLAGERILINKAMEYEFTHQASTETEKQIEKMIHEWHLAEVTRLEQELFAQKKRLNDAVRVLAEKTTKKAENDKRVATNKIERALRDLERHKSMEILAEDEARIFPLHYMSVLCLDEKGEKVIRPMRYLMRPHNKDESFDQKFNGCYNARFDNLESVPWWKDSLGQRHGLILVKKFYENVALEDYAKNFKVPDEMKKQKSLVLCFEPGGVEYMFIPVLWDLWTKKGQPDLCSAALITDEPLPEIAETGHNRTPIFLPESAIEDWLSADFKTAKNILKQRQIVRYSHSLVSAA